MATQPQTTATVTYEPKQYLRPVTVIDYVQEKGKPFIPPKIIYGELKPQYGRSEALPLPQPKPLPFPIPNQPTPTPKPIPQLPQSRAPPPLVPITPLPFPLPQPPKAPETTQSIDPNILRARYIASIEDRNRAIVGLPYRRTQEEINFQRLQSAKEFINPLSEEVNEIISLGGIIERPITRTIYPSVSTVSATGAKGTAIFRNPTRQEMTPEQQVESQLNEIGVDTAVKTLALEKNLIAKYGEQVQQGKLTPESASALATSDYETAINQISKQNDLKYQDIEKQFNKNVLLAESPVSFGKGFVLGAITALAPPIGVTLGAIELAKSLTETDQLVQQASENPFEFGVNVGSGVLGAAIGGVVVPKVTNVAIGEFRTFGKTYIPEEKIIESTVLSGKTTFPESFEKNPELRAQEFIERTLRRSLPGSEGKLGGFHATTEKFSPETIAGAGTSGQKGLFTAPSLSSYFLRLRQGYQPFGFSLDSQINANSRALRIYTEKILPLKDLNKLEQGYLYVINPKVLGYLKPELEAIFKPGTPLTRLTNKFYSRYAGVSFPIQEYLALSEEESASIPKDLLIDIETVLKETSGRTRPAPVISPTYFQSFYNKTGSYRFPSRNIPGVFVFGGRREPSPGILNYSYNQDKIVSSLSNAPTRFGGVSYKSPSRFGYSPITKTTTELPGMDISREVFEFPGLTTEKKRRRKERRQRALYTTFVRRRGRYQPVAFNLPRAQAVYVGQQRTLSSLARTFKIRESGFGFSDREVSQFANLEPQLFRPYRIQRGRKIPLNNIFIQRNPIVTREEKELLRLARRKRF